MRWLSRVQAGSELLFFYGSFCIERSIDIYGFAANSATKCFFSNAKKSRAAPSAKASSLRPAFAHRPASKGPLGARAQLG